MTRKGQPKVRTGCLTCKSRKVKCDEAKPACARCTGTGRRCEGYAVVVPSNRAIARARSRTTRLREALAQARASWAGGGSEKATLEYFARDVAPKLPQNLENQFWTVAVPRMSKSEPAIRHAMVAIASLFPQLRSSSNPVQGENPQADAHYSEALRLMARRVAPERDGGHRQSSSNDGPRAAADDDSRPRNLSLTSLSSRSSPSLANAAPYSAIHSPAPLTPSLYSSMPDLPETDRSSSRGPTNLFASPQSQEDDGDEEPTHYNDVDVVLSCCILFIATEFLRGSLDEAMRHLANGINILNNVDYAEVDQTTLDEIVPKFHRLSIIQLCFYDKPNFPSLNLQHGHRPRYNLGPFDRGSSIYLTKRAVDPIILDAIRYIRSADPGSQTDSRLASRGPVMSEEQKSICTSLDRWHAAFLAFVDAPRKPADPPLPKHQGLICAETEMKYQTAKICISVCRSHDESVYDCFKDPFRRIVTLARLILDSFPDADPAEFAFDFTTSYLPLLEFVITKCRWLDIRYEAWRIVRALATERTPRVARGGLHLVGQRMIEREHNAKMDEVTRHNAGLFSLPAEEMRVKDYTADPRFADLVPVPGGGGGDARGGGPPKVQVPYTQRLLLRCGSCELDDLAAWMENKRPSRSPSS
ncbi:hypothetical protein CGRA01v4_06528 [Colletotrichum graminicola]|uniref:Zn(2)-C6 fungal-type domain-containing protein n=1 Tax=Colletotrichum graminicola (strain M1.001 / M2 / FGSC 10212) TaxID=645133 RepID=E3Q236_COLGM|nr:uncharacterized protein GLRG_00281 [Colletotrichum graminicola M1.001]EFQ25137.1 hypothetical protein GLRG_00281 [Colletotrichum graminicola M1.001]WDK15247.1 hypothetical protein CGRA01v4_06528 [Colletotrichum graminicola]